MTDPYTYAAMIVNKTEESRIISIIMDIVETDFISDKTLELQCARVEKLRKLGEDRLSDAIERDRRTFS